MTKSHVKYLESRLIQIALSTKRYKIENSNQSQLSSLPRADKDAMEEFLIYIKLLIGVLGHKLLEEIAFVTKKKEETIQLITTAKTDYKIETANNIELFLSVATLKASALQTDEGIVVLEGSEAAKEYTNSLSHGYRELREKLITNGDLVLDGNKYIFKKNVLFDTASPAAAIIVGYSINGPYTWKNKDGKSLKEIEQQRLQNVNGQK